MADKFTMLNKRLKAVHQKFVDLKNSGIDEDILVAYLQVRTGFSKKQVQIFLESYELFYRKLMKEEVAAAI